MYYMLDRLPEKRQAINAANVELDVPVKLCSADWVLAEKVMKILKLHVLGRPVMVMLLQL